MSRKEAKEQINEDAFVLNDDDLYPDVQPWFRDRSANNWNLKGATWGGIHPQDLDRLQSQKKKKVPVKSEKLAKVSVK